MIDNTLYDEIISYTSKRNRFITKGSLAISVLDVAHDVIVDDSFQVDSWRHLVDRHIYSKVAELRIKVVPLDQMHIPNREVEEKWVCKKCQNDYPKSSFHLSFAICDKCYRHKHKDRIRVSQKKSDYKRRSRKSEYNKMYNLQHRDRLIALKREYYKKNKEKLKKSSAEYRQKNKESIRTYMLKYREENRERIQQYRREYREKNKEKISQYRRDYYLKTKEQ